MLIDQSYFVGELSIPTNTAGTLERLDLFIKKYEPELLQEILGYELYRDYKASAPIAVPYTYLQNGKEYTDRTGRLVKWQGLRQTSPVKKSLVANYVYYQWLRDQDTQNTTIGVAQAKSENAARVSPIDKMVNAWNEMSAWIKDLICFLEQHPDDFPQFRRVDRWYILGRYRPQNRFGI
jgi:hypothetical protein